MIINKKIFIFVAWIMLLLTACTSEIEPNFTPLEVTIPATQTPDSAESPEHQFDPTYAAMIAAKRDPRIPELPFADNPDPNQCGIPIQWGLDEPAWLNGIYEGEMIQPVVLLYDSHLRLSISGEAPHGSEVKVKLFQENPVTDYYLVEVAEIEETIEGWIPAPLLSFEPVEPLAED